MTTQPSKTVYRSPDWEAWAREDETGYRPPARQSFVPAATPKLEMLPIRLADVAQAPVIAPTAVVSSATVGDHVSRANAWLRYALPLCLSFALAVLVVLALTTPLLNADLVKSALRAVCVLFVAFSVSYGIFVLRYWADSPEGQAKENSRSLWRFIEREQDHRQAIEWEAWELTKAAYQKQLEG